MRDAKYELTWKIRRTFKLLGALADQYLEKHGISASERAVMEFISSWGPSSVPDLARNFYVSRQNIQVRVNGLMKKGLMEKHVNPAHKKSSLIALSVRGTDLFAAIKTEENGIISGIFSSISDNEVAAATQTINKLIDSLTDELNDKTEA
ncbi:MAG: MarR family transcriptional regulator [Alphaproteobacteria bacterium]|nr:MarR family transcriptional regulator [Alphaproteobacteria bacterium]